MDDATSRCRILFVEDHHATRVALSKLLGLYGYDLTTADCCATALRVAHAQPFELLIADVGLPDGDGWNLLEQMRVRYPLLRGIVMSGFAMPADVRHTQLAGYARHVTKPVDAEALRAVIEEVMSPRQASHVL
jgi:two-component system CheB/CheR fusion protein